MNQFTKVLLVIIAIGLCTNTAGIMYWVLTDPNQWASITVCFAGLLCEVCLLTRILTRDEQKG